MHSHDRTLLAKLGFGDPDRADARHDAACQYLARLPIAEKMLDFMSSFLPSGEQFRYVPYSKEPYYQFSRKPFTLEYHICKGEGQYATTIGFADVVMNLDSYRWHFCGGRHCCWSDLEEERGQRYLLSEYQTHIGIEVKISKDRAGDFLRQIKLYQAYTKFRHWALVTDFPLPARDVESLRRENVFHFQLGSDFESWLDSQSSQSDLMTSPML